MAGLGLLQRGQFGLDGLDPVLSLFEGHVAGRLDLGAVNQQPVQLGDAHHLPV